MPLPPDPRINEALGLQHNLQTALADLIDNSIDAGARKVWVRFIVSDDRVTEILVADDGRGMGREGITNAFILGAQQQYGEARLGHFGVGMKASAFSQAEILTVISRASGEKPVAMTARRSGADGLVADTYTTEAVERSLEAADLPFRTETGTVLRLGEIRTASVADDPADRRRWVNDRVLRLREHLGLVFHRFLADGRLAITIDIWDAVLAEAGVAFHPTPINPFGVTSGKAGYPRPMVAELPGGESIAIGCHLLSPGSRTRETHISGKSRVDWHGIYVYRNDRLLSLGGWGDVVMNPGTNLQLARVAVEMTSGSEKWFGLNAEKNGVVLLPDMVNAILRAGDEDVSFHDYLADARDLMRQANRRDRSVKPLSPIGVGIPREVEELAGSMLGFNESERSVNIRWQALPPERVFALDHDRATIWLNDKHRDILQNGGSDDPHGLIKTLLFLLFESHFPQAHLQRQTFEQIEAWQRLVAVALGVAETPGADVEAEDEPAGPTEKATDDHDVAATEDPNRDEFEDDENPQDIPDPGPDFDAWAPVPAGTIVISDSQDEPEQPKRKKPRIVGTDDALRDYLRDIGRFPLLDAAEEVEFAIQVEAGVLAEEQLASLSEREKRSAQGRDLSWVARQGHRAKNALVNSNLRLVVSLARRYQNRGLEMLDLIQEGSAGLIHAVEKFDYAKGFKFSTYATWWIRQAITRAIADKGSAIRLPVHMVEVGTKISNARNLLSEEMGRTPTNAEIASRADIPEQTVELFLRMSKPVTSLNRPTIEGDWNESEELAPDEFGAPRVTVTEYGETLVDDFDPIEAALAAMMLQSQVKTVLDALDDRSRQIISMRFGLGGEDAMTLDAIGDSLGVTRERVRQLEKKALDLLRSPAVMFKLVGAAEEPAAEQPKPAVRLRKIDSTSSATPATPTDLEEVEQLAEFVGSLSALEPDDEDSLETPDAPERGWTPIELLALLRAYRDVRHIGQAAQITGAEERDAAIALTRLLVWERGPVDDFINAPNHGAAWTPEDSTALIAEFAADPTLENLARKFGRTQLAIAWRLLNNTSHPIAIPGRLLDPERIERAWSEVRRRQEAWARTAQAS